MPVRCLTPDARNTAHLATTHCAIIQIRPTTGASESTSNLPLDLSDSFCDPPAGLLPAVAGIIDYSTMATTATGHGTRRFMHALAAILLVACSLPCASGNDASSAKAVKEKARALFEAVQGNPPAAAAAAVAAADNPAEWTRPGSLLDRGTALLYEGNSKDAVIALDAAILGWEAEVCVPVLTLFVSAAEPVHRGLLTPMTLR